MIKVQRTWLWMLGLAVLAAGGFACGTTSNETDGGDGEDGGFNTCHIDNSMRGGIDPEWELKPGVEAKSQWICPKGDIDYYWFNATAAGTIVRVRLRNSVTMSPVNLCYTIFSKDDNTTPVGKKCDDNGMDGVTDIAGTHYLKTAGTYFVEVRDAGNANQDPKNAYMISIDTVVDPDTYEPNNNKNEAKAATTSLGFISFLGDEDWFQINVPSAGQMLLLDLTTAAATPVDLHYSVFGPDGTSIINVGENQDGMSGPTALHDVLALPSAGTYFVQVTDVGGNDSDVTVGYTLQLSYQQNPDSRDRSPDNNNFDRATKINSGETISDAYIATRADVDWYYIEAPGVSDTQPAIIEVELIATGSKISPAVDLIVADPRNACSPGDACARLESFSCGGECKTSECRNAQCPSHECLFQDQKCAGAGMCLPPGGCGIRSLIMRWSANPAEDFSEGDGRRLHTVAPMYGSRYYLYVRDFEAKNYDYQVPYSLKVTVRDEPDTHEAPPNGIYLPYATNEMEEDTVAWNTRLASTISCQDSGSEVVCGPIVGYLSFRGDQDWYKLTYTSNFDESETLEQCPEKVDWGIMWDWNQATPNLSINYGLFYGAGEFPDTGFYRDGAGSGTFGSGADECSYICGEYQTGRPLYLRVQHSDRRLYDFQNSYSVTLRFQRTCPDNCSYCAAGQTNYPCPNLKNPKPGGTCPSF